MGDVPEDWTDINEQEFQNWYSTVSKLTGLNPDPDDPNHFYDYRGFYQGMKRGEYTISEDLHFPSRFKKEGHPRMILDGINTKTGEEVSP